jgi:hypothetical protein
MGAQSWPAKPSWVNQAIRTLIRRFAIHRYEINTGQPERTLAVFVGALGTEG